MNHRNHSIRRVVRQRGLTLIEFMVAIVLGMLMVAAIATLIANQSTNRAEIDRSGKMIENGRYALQAIAQDLEMAGYWGETPKTPDAPATLPDPCATTIAGAGNLQEAMGLHVQGFDAAATIPTCLSTRNVKPGTDILVVRHADPVTSDVETGGLVDWGQLKPGQVYLQTGINTATDAFASVLAVADGTNDSTTFYLKRRGGVNVASPRKYLVHIYYVATCDVCSGGSADTIPTLKRLDLVLSGGAMTMATTPFTIAQGIEDMQVDYGRDTLPAGGDGAPDGADVNGSALTTAADWGDVMSAKVHLLARSTESTPGYVDAKTFTLGTKNVAAANDGYRRHVFVQSVRIVNPSGRRAS